MELHQKLLQIQSQLKAPKNQYNDFGKYSYRSCEDILEAVKPHLIEQELIMTITDELVSIDGWYYIKAIITLTDGTDAANGTIEVSALARETETRPKFDSAQLTGSASSYARKYALNGLFLIDDTKDSDATNNRPQEPTAKITPKVSQKQSQDKPDYISKNKHSRLESLITKKGVEREGIREAIGQMRKIHPADKEFENIHLNEITEHEYKQITDKLNEREDA